VALLFGVYYALRVRNVEEKFNESASLGMSIYMTVAIAIFCIVIGFPLRTAPNVELVLFSFGLIAGLTFTVGAQFIPKFINIIYYREDPKTGISTRSNASGLRMSKRGGDSVQQGTNDSTMDSTPAGGETGIVMTGRAGNVDDNGTSP